MTSFRTTLASLVCATCASLPAGERCPARCARNFVLGAWSSSFKDSDEAGMLTTEDYTRIMHDQIAKICARRECRVYLAVGTGAPVFGGFIAGEPSERVVYYCFVKGQYRRRGLARQLFRALGIDPRSRFAFPCRTPSTFDLRGKIPLAIRDRAVAVYSKSERHRSYAA